MGDMREIRSAVDDADELTHLRALLFKFYVPVLLGEQRVVPAATDVGPGMETRASLANDDIAREYFLAAIDLHAQAFTL